MQASKALQRLLEDPTDPERVAVALERVAHGLNNPLGGAHIETWNLARVLDRVTLALENGRPQDAATQLADARAILANLAASHDDLRTLLAQVQDTSEALHGE